jgi:hypothetical protein
MSRTVVHFLKYDETRQASNWWGRTGLPQHLAINKNLVGKTTISRLFFAAVLMGSTQASALDCRAQTTANRSRCGGWIGLKALHGFCGC